MVHLSVSRCPEPPRLHLCHGHRARPPSVSGCKALMDDPLGRCLGSEGVIVGMSASQTNPWQRPCRAPGAQAAGCGCSCRGCGENPSPCPPPPRAPPAPRYAGPGCDPAGRAQRAWASRTTAQASRPLLGLGLTRSSKSTAPTPVSAPAPLPEQPGVNPQPPGLQSGFLLVPGCRGNPKLSCAAFRNVIRLQGEAANKGSVEDCASAEGASLRGQDPFWEQVPPFPLK